MASNYIVLSTITIYINLQPDILTEIVEKSNYLFIGIFTIEMLFKLVAEGGLQYIKDIFNVFDGIIVILRSVDESQSMHLLSKRDTNLTSHFYQYYTCWSILGLIIFNFN